MSHEIISLVNDDMKTSIYDGEIVSLSYNDQELFHGAGKPDHMKMPSDHKGWSRSEILMFPVVGPVNDFKVLVGDGWVSHDQHGISRVIGYSCKESSLVHASFSQKHDSMMSYPNPKFKEGSSNPRFISWPFSYEIEKHLELAADSLKATFTITNDSDKDMPFMFGWHPAFKVYGDTSDNLFFVDDKIYGLDAVVRESKANNALKIAGADKVVFENKKTGVAIEINAHNFGSFMIWSPDNDAGMVCIEPVTHLPVSLDEQDYFSKDVFEMLKPNERKSYSVLVKIKTYINR